MAVPTGMHQLRDFSRFWKKWDTHFTAVARGFPYAVSHVCAGVSPTSASRGSDPNICFGNLQELANQAGEFTEVFRIGIFILLPLCMPELPVLPVGHAQLTGA